MKNTCTRWRWLCSVEASVSGRISPPADAADRLNGLRAHIPAEEERRALEEVREMAKVLAIPSARNLTCSARAVICSARGSADRHAPE